MSQQIDYQTLRLHKFCENRIFSLTLVAPLKEPTHERRNYYTVFCYSFSDILTH